MKFKSNSTSHNNQFNKFNKVRITLHLLVGSISQLVQLFVRCEIKFDPCVVYVFIYFT